MMAGSRPYRWTGIRAASREEYMRKWRALRHNPDTAFHEGESPHPEQAKPTGGSMDDQAYRNAYARWWRQEQKRNGRAVASNSSMRQCKRQRQAEA